METKAYTVKGPKGDRKLLLEATGPGEMPTDEAVQDWYEAHGHPRVGAVTIPGFAACQVERKAVHIANHGPAVLHKLAPGEFPPDIDVQKVYEQQGRRFGIDVQVSGSAPCLLTT